MQNLFLLFFLFKNNKTAGYSSMINPAVFLYESIVIVRAANC